MSEAFTETWRPIPSAPEFAASSLGRIKRIIGSRTSAVGKIKRLTLKSDGYYAVNLRSGGRDRSFLVHRVICEAFHGPAPSPRHHAAHGNGDRSVNHPSNLRWATPTENAADKEIHGTVRRGEGHQFSKLTSAAVAEIRNAPKGRKGHGQLARLAAKFGVTECHVARLRTPKGAHWRGVPFPAGSDDARR